MIQAQQLGYVPASKLGSELLFNVISTAYERTREDNRTLDPRAVARYDCGSVTQCPMHRHVICGQATPFGDGYHDETVCFYYLDDIGYITGTGCTSHGRTPAL